MFYRFCVVSEVVFVLNWPYGSFVGFMGVRDLSGVLCLFIQNNVINVLVFIRRKLNFMGWV